MRLSLISLFLAASSLLGQQSTDPQQTLDPQTWLTRGIQAYRSAQYQDAIAAFQKSLGLDPNNLNARQYLATTYMTLYIPGGNAPDNLENARKAAAGFEQTLALDPGNRIAILSLASLHYQESMGIVDLEEKFRKVDEARDWYKKGIGLDPNNKEAYYSLGVIAWSKWYPAMMKARAQLGMRPEDPGPLRDAAVRLDLKTKYEAMIDEGIANLEKALQLDPKYDDAMAYVNLLVRERADLRDTPEEYRQDVATADEWVQRALETRKEKGPVAGQAASAPSRIRVGGNVQAANLIRKVDPIYPALAHQARIQGTVRFTAVIGKDGSIINLQLVSGHPLLVAAAQEAAKQWQYKPTLLNGEPVEVVTQVDVNFTIPPAN